VKGILAWSFLSSSPTWIPESVHLPMEVSRGVGATCTRERTFGAQ
jgi:hypothetical protein